MNKLQIKHLIYIRNNVLKKQMIFWNNKIHRKFKKLIAKWIYKIY